jgi:outer membrane protein OmpA-like peptidoglycan-associated protein
MKYQVMKGAVVAGLLLVVTLGCQTAKPVLVAPAESAVEVEKSGFSPAGGAEHSSIEISMRYGNGEAIKSWKVEVGSGGNAVKAWSGSASYLPASISWDGKSDSGTMAPEGRYTARLSVEYAAKYLSASAESRSFVLDITPPKGTIAVDPPQFTPLDTGVAGPVTLTINASSTLARIESWSLDVQDEAGALVKNWSGRWPDASTTWDGSSMDSGFVMPSMTYHATATVRDEYGNSSEITADIPVAALAAAPRPPAPPPPPKPGQPSVTAKTAGLSPNGDKVADTITFQLGYGQGSAVVAWKLSLSVKGAEPRKTFSGDGSSLPETVVWDGKSDGGQAAPEGIYTATLAVEYGTAFAPGTAASQPFILAVTPPTAAIALSSPLFSPMESSGTISLKVDARSALAKIDSWTLDIYDPGGDVFRSFTGKWPADTAVWDGKGAGGEMVQSAEDYPVTAKVRDQFGNVGTARATVPIDILVEKTATGYRILSSRIFFKAFTADYLDVEPGLALQNLERLDALAAKLKKFPDYRIRMVGHAVMIYWDDPERGQVEQEEILIPLSAARAEAVKAALVARGLDAARVTTEGVGASDQLVPDSDYTNRWQNRRVALFLEKE